MVNAFKNISLDLHPLKSFGKHFTSFDSRVGVWDGWRGLAILLVLVGHFTFTQWIWEERMGVDIFFVLSGMLMSNILFIDRMQMRDFYIRRLSRVIPTLLLFLCAAYVVSVLLRYDFSISEFIAKMLFIRSYFPADPSYFSATPPTGHLWSLNVEEHSYFIMSLLSLFLFKRSTIIFALISIYLLSVGINFYHYSIMPSAEFEESLIRTESAIGFIAFSAAYHLIRLKYSIVVRPFIPGLLLLVALVLYLRVVPIWFTFLVCPLLLGIAANHLKDASGALQKVLTFAPMQLLGLMSYSIYLWQQIFYKLYYVLPGGAFTGFLLSIVVGAASYYFFEQPVRKYINQRWSPNPQFNGRP